MRKLILAAAAATGLMAVTAVGASAAPVAGLHAGPNQAVVTKADYDNHYRQGAHRDWHREWHHRYWEHGRWYYR